MLEIENYSEDSFFTLHVNFPVTSKTMGGSCPVFKWARHNGTEMGHTSADHQRDVFSVRSGQVPCTKIIVGLFGFNQVTYTCNGDFLTPTVVHDQYIDDNAQTMYDKDFIFLQTVDGSVNRGVLLCVITDLVK